MQDFRKLLVWEEAHQLTLAVYKSTKHFPNDELYGLRGQLRRAASSIPSNIAEGCGRGTDADFARFVQIALGSASELGYHLLLTHDLNYLNKTIYLQLITQNNCIMRMLNGLLKKLKANSP